MTSPVIGTPWKKLNAPVSEEAIEGVDKYWRAANYLSIGQIYLRSNPLMKEPFTREDVKHRLVGHWGHHPRPELPHRPHQPVSSLITSRTL